MVVATFRGTISGSITSVQHGQIGPHITVTFVEEGGLNYRNFFKESLLWAWELFTTAGVEMGAEII